MYVYNIIISLKYLQSNKQIVRNEYWKSKSKRIKKNIILKCTQDGSAFSRKTTLDTNTK